MVKLDKLTQKIKLAILKNDEDEVSTIFKNINYSPNVCINTTLKLVEKNIFYNSCVYNITPLVLAIYNAYIENSNNIDIKNNDIKNSKNNDIKNSKNNDIEKEKSMNILDLLIENQKKNINRPFTIEYSYNFEKLDDKKKKL